MCGIAALLGEAGRLLSCDVGDMVAAMPHRGPDAQGIWSGDGIAIGHARLSVVDLSPAGAQPMVSRDGRWTVAFNGEIYNHHELRADLPGPWRGHSDTETLVAAIAAWGVGATLQRCVGMFAIAAWDEQRRSLWLARDRMGEKPLYYGALGGVFRVASELKAILADGMRPEVDRGSVALLLRHNYIPAPYTIWQGLRKLIPGHVLEIPQSAWDRPAVSRSYWSVDTLVGQVPFAGCDSEAIERLDELLRASIHGQMVADVPLGAFLSGGIDSSVVVALMQQMSTRPVRTFTIGFTERDFDEAPHAEAVARHLGTDHTTLRITGEEARAVIRELPMVWDEPFADASQIPTLMLSRLARQQVTVSLSGDGGDELFGGYNRYTLLAKLHRMQRMVPTYIRKIGAEAMTVIPPWAWDGLACPFPKIQQVGDKLHKLAAILPAPDVDSLYRGLISHWSDPEAAVLNGKEPLAELASIRSSRIANHLSRFQFMDQMSYLPDDILTKVDRAAMSTSLETRVPLLDHRIVEFSWSLPDQMKIRRGQGKWILRQVLDRYVPRPLIDRPKTGFAIPLAAWLRGPLRAWAESLLAEDRLRREGFFHPALIRRQWAEHLSGRRNWQYRLWGVLMFQAWWECWRQPNVVSK